MKKAVLLIVLLLAGCGRMSYDQVITAEKYCRDRNLTPVRFVNAYKEVGLVECQASDGTIYRSREE